MNVKFYISLFAKYYIYIYLGGLCGHFRYSLNSKHSKESDNTSKEPLSFSHRAAMLCQHIKELEPDWFNVATSTCNYGKNDGKFEQIYLSQCGVHDIISLIERVINKWNESHKHYDTLNNIKYDIIEWCVNNNIDGSKFGKIGRKEFGSKISMDLNNKKMNRPLLILYDELIKYDINCGPLKRISIILSHFKRITDELHSTNQRYPYEIKKFLYALKSKKSSVEIQSSYSPIKLLDDIDHILTKHADTLQFQPYIKCAMDTECKHFDVATRANNKYKTFKDKQEYFHCDNWKDYVYISALSKLHTVILHKDKSPLIIQNDVATIKKYNEYPVYSTGNI